MRRNYTIIDQCHSANEDASDFMSLDSSWFVWGDVYDASLSVSDACTREAIWEALA